MYFENNASFGVDGYRHEIEVYCNLNEKAKGSPPRKWCSDGSEVVEDLTVGAAERGGPLQTHLRKCASQTEILNSTRPKYNAVVCHPFMRAHSGPLRWDRHLMFPETWAIQRWVEHYTARGFDQVFIYLHDYRLVQHAVKNVTWIIAPWLEDTRLHYGGQLTAIHHCLYYNKGMGTKWVLFADVDEYVVITDTYATNEDNLIQASQTMSNATDVAAYDYGHYPITEPLMGSNTMPMVQRIFFRSKMSKDGEPISNKGHRKQLVNVAKVKVVGVHSLPKFIESQKSEKVYHFHPKNMSLLHVRKLIPYTLTLQPIRRHRSFLCRNHS